MNQRVSRRAFVLAGAALALAPLSACKFGGGVSFNGTDITGADYGKDFRLFDPEGKERTLADFKDKVVLVFFGFTQCPDVCPTALARASEVKQLLGPDGDRLQVLFISVDPERDTPEILHAYTAAFDPTFLALYGDPARLAETAKAFNVVYQKVPTGSSYTIDHTAVTYAYDPQGRLRLKLSHNQSSIEYAADVRKLLHAA
jgi:protein SCO1/2